MAFEPRATVRDWIANRTAQAPATLVRQMIAALGADADAPEARTAEACLAAAGRSLDAIVSEQKFGREHALELLAVDALTTIAFEHASQGAPSQAEGEEGEGEGDAQMAALAKRSASMLGQLSAQRV